MTAPLQPFQRLVDHLTTVLLNPLLELAAGYVHKKSIVGRMAQARGSHPSRVTLWIDLRFEILKDLLPGVHDFVSKDWVVALPQPQFSSSRFLESTWACCPFDENLRIFPVIIFDLSILCSQTWQRPFQFIMPALGNLWGIGGSRLRPVPSDECRPKNILLVCSTPRRPVLLHVPMACTGQ